MVSWDRKEGEHLDLLWAKLSTPSLEGITTLAAGWQIQIKGLSDRQTKLPLQLQGPGLPSSRVFYHTSDTGYTLWALAQLEPCQILVAGLRKVPRTT